MDSESEKINSFLVSVFNNILRMEEASLKERAGNLSMREMHVIEAVCDAVTRQQNTASEIALSQNITAGTLTATVSTLEKKGFLIRRQDDRDKRMVRIFPTEKGKTANEIHQSFHHEMVSAIQSVLKEDELKAFVRGLAAVQHFFESKNKD